jgi:hypothetical protein
MEKILNMKMSMAIERWTLKKVKFIKNNGPQMCKNFDEAWQYQDIREEGIRAQSALSQIKTREVLHRSSKIE